MWYLVLPPLIIIVVLAFLVWFVARRLPRLQATLSDMHRNVLSQSTWSGRAGKKVGGMFWSISEYTTRRFRLWFLKAHNMLNRVTEFIRRKREGRRDLPLQTPGQPARIASRLDRDAGGSTRLVQAPAERTAARTVASLFKRRVSLRSEGTDLSDKRTLTETVVDQADSVAAPEVPAVPAMPTETPLSFMRRSSLSHGRTEGETPSPKDQFEQLLVERIVANPRDIEAYERLGDYYLERDSLMDAKECYRQVLKLSPINRLVKIKIRRLERMLEKR